MKFDAILSRRKIDFRNFYDLVYEWEEVLSAVTGIPLEYEKAILCHNVGSRIPLLFNMLMPHKEYFFYDMYSNIFIRRNRNLPNVSPCIIDFFMTKEEIKKFEHNYNKNRVVFISSREAFDFLKENDCQLNIAHLPLSISDKYLSQAKQTPKIFDIALVGRQNPVLKSFLEKYCREERPLKIVQRKVIKGKDVFALNDITIINDETSRASYLDVLSKAKITFYNTPGIDGGEIRTKGFNQVTPRFLEGIASGCHVISRYKQNPDTDYFELDKMTCNISDYNQFKNQLDRALAEPIDCDKYQDYLRRHSTSHVAKMLLEY